MNAGDGRSIAPGRASPPVEAAADAQALSDGDQTLADADQTGSDLDQTTADADQSASERDQLASDRDQHAADDDQAASDRARDGSVNGTVYARTRRARSQSTIERDQGSQARLETARIRDEDAARRDRLAEERDGAARARDELATTLDAEIERLEVDSRGKDGAPSVGLDLLLRAASDRKRAAASRARAAVQREAAARDRERAAEDRRQAASDRVAAAEELAREGTDQLTGALRRHVGLAAIQREMDRTQRTRERLVVAFVDVNGLKSVNDTHGHAAGDQLLCDVARSIMQHLRSYDVIVRFGGDEFVCSLSGQDAAGARDRFQQIAAQLEDTAHGAAFTVGLAERLHDDSLDELIHRADGAMIELRRHPEE
jgi:diguanylate cyclase (GGDEF)-like protein